MTLKQFLNRPNLTKFEKSFELEKNENVFFSLFLWIGFLSYNFLNSNTENWDWNYCVSLVKTTRKPHLVTQTALFYFTSRQVSSKVC